LPSLVTATGLAHGDLQNLFADHVPLQMSRVTAVELDMLRNVQDFLKVSVWLFQCGYILYKISCFCNCQWNELKQWLLTWGKFPDP